jgi:hypothetical protein
MNWQMPAAKPILELIAFAPLVDEYCDVLAARETYAPNETKYRRLHEKIKELTHDADPKDEFLIRGDRYTLRVSARGFERKPDIPKVRKKMGAAAFLEIATVTLKSLGDFFTKPQVDEMVITTQTGTRMYEPRAVE